MVGGWLAVWLSWLMVIDHMNGMIEQQVKELPLPFVNSLERRWSGNHEAARPLKYLWTKQSTTARATATTATTANWMTFSDSSLQVHNLLTFPCTVWVDREERVEEGHVRVAV